MQPTAKGSWLQEDYRLPLLAGLLFVLANLLQAALTPLDPDEAYYWFYADRLQWGYYDHPPAIALLIKLGISLFPATLGLRFGSVLASGLCLWLLWQLAGRPVGRQAALLALLVAAMPFLELYGFIATPDGPLLLATAFFWWVYARFLQRPGLGQALLLGTSMALLLYSKYHGLLVILFTVFSNLQLWRMPAFYLAGLSGVLLFMPHLYWQYANDFPSFRYHLVGRDDPYELKHTINYLVNQLSMFNPLLLPWWAPALWRSRQQEPLARAFFVTAMGFWLFFLWSTFKGHAEPQWTAVLSIPLVLLLFRSWQSGSLRSPWFGRMLVVSLLLFVLLRVALVIPDKTPLRQMRNADWIADLSAYAGDTPLLFENSYRDASLYRFYTGKAAWNMTNVLYRPSQYDLWEGEKALHNRTVVVVGQRGWPCPAPCDTLQTGRLFKHLLRADSFQVLTRVAVKLTACEPRLPQPGDTLRLHFSIHNQYPFAVNPAAGGLPAQLALLASSGLEQWHYWPLTYTPGLLAPGEQRSLTWQWVVPADYPPGAPPFGLGWQYIGMPPAWPVQ